ncbi:hypothetical protein PLESTB_001627600 [Pleodorina starrii]|uniref:CAAX prenyl protease 2/Lysostaphin resistance protein A-like domain-containing protein n=1 Tax=Pleodorina starrii TaxID=330485 RepID=A0A9W6F8P6_9CHLO|nr:hypothetical protein PLESTM_000911200 [Pleodorina starrii]GLC60567.1 hypothetical protein PLESTB_001627600 [Pleodorina starrii]GLC77147.1 hypothetical protein PLESTF_001891300 [Pleodorina starrii]
MARCSMALRNRDATTAARRAAPTPPHLSYGFWASGACITSPAVLCRQRLDLIDTPRLHRSACFNCRCSKDDPGNINLDRSSVTRPFNRASDVRMPGPGEAGTSEAEGSAAPFGRQQPPRAPQGEPRDGAPHKHNSREPPDSDPDEAAYRSGQLPTAMEGLNWWCYTVLGLLFITDFTPLGPLLLQGSRDAALYLCAVQWILFVLPTLKYCRERGWDLGRLLRLRPCAPSWLLAGLALGPALWLATAAAIAARTGVDFSQLAGSAAPDSPTAGLLFGELLQRPDDVGQWLRVLATSAVSPAAAEELLYRGFLLTAMRQRFGAVDAVALTAALFAAAHLSIPQFFAFTLLGGACGGLVLVSGSVAPAVAAHAAYNATGIAAGVATALAAAAATAKGL